MNRTKNSPSSSSFHTTINRNNITKPNLSNINSKRTPNDSISSNTSNDVFTVDDPNDPDFQLVKNKSKRILSLNSSSRSSDNKKPKSVFVSSNRFNSLQLPDNEISIETNGTSNNINSNNDEHSNHIPIPPPIFVRNVSDFIELRNQLIKLIGPQNFSFKSSATNLKISTTNPDSYREVIKYLITGKAEYHTYQARENKAFRIVIRNLHPSSPTVDIGAAIEDIGYSVRHVSNVIHKSTKCPLPIFFVDLEPAQINNEIFKLTSLLHTKIKVEEPHKRREIIQCSNCQEYGHSKGYCAHPPRCVRCADFHPTTQCTQSKDISPTCALCRGNHTANYRGCSVHKNLQRSSYKPNSTFQKNVNNYTNVNKQETRSSEMTHSPPPNINDNKTFPNLTQNPPNHSFPKTTDSQSNSTDNISNNQLSSFLIEFKQLINPLIQLLTTVINKLISQNVK